MTPRPEAPRRRRRLAVLKSPPFDGGVLPYRIDELGRLGFELRWTEGHRRVRPALLHRAVAHLEARATPFLQTLLLLPRIVSADATLAFFESEGNAYGTLRSVLPPLRRRHYVVLTCWLSELLEEAARAGDERRLSTYRRAFRHVDRVLCLSASQVDILCRHLELPAGRVAAVTFGVDAGRFAARPPTGGGGYVVAVGRDRGRDWPTLLAAASACPVPVKVACRPGDLAGLEVPANVEVLGYLEPGAYAALLAGAEASVVCTLERTYPTGQTVLLESMAAGVPTVVTATPALRDYLVDEAVVVVPPGDPAAVAAALDRILGDRELRQVLAARARAAVEERFTAESFWSEVASHLDPAPS